MTTPIHRRRLILKSAASPGALSGSLDPLLVSARAKITSHWALNEDSGAALDSVGSLNLTANNNPLGVTGKVGKGRQIVPASSQSLTIADNAALRVQNASFAIYCWFNVASSASSQYLVSKAASSTATAVEYGLRVATNGAIGMLKSDGSLSPILGGATITYNVWNFVAFWYDLALNTMYIQLNNGAINSLAANTGFAGTGDFAIGKLGAAASNYANGIIDEVSFAKGDFLTADERAFLYNSGAGRAIY